MIAKVRRRAISAAGVMRKTVTLPVVSRRTTQIFMRWWLEEIRQAAEL
jgi:hypothetical protein